MNDTPTTPTTSLTVARAGSSGPAIAFLACAITVVAVLVLVSVFAVKAAAGALTAELKTLRQGNEEAYRWTKVKAEETQRVLDEQLRALHQIQSPPTNDKLFTIMSKGIGVSENVVATGEVGTTPAAAFATDLTTAQQTDAYTQEIVITNRDDTTNLCFKPIAWASAGANCNAKCIAAAASITCPAPSAAGTTATDGTVTPPLGSWPRRYDGTSCICIVGSAAATAYQTERVLR